MNYEGIMTALVTPFTSEKKVDAAKFEKLINFQIENGVDSLLVLGGTGEYTSLNNAQKKEVIDVAINIVKERVPVIVGIIDPGIGSSVEIGLYAKEAGASAAMIVTPYYAKPTQQGIENYYKELDKALDMPIILYNIPHKTGVNMLPGTVKEIINASDNFVAIKECSENFGQMIELINLVGDSISVLAGEEFIAVSSMAFGAKGAVMASANVIPDVWVKLYRHVKNRELDEAMEINKKYYPVFKAIFSEGNPGPLKNLLASKGLTDDEINLPLLKPKQTTKEILDRLKL